MEKEHNRNGTHTPERGMDPKMNQEKGTWTGGKGEGLPDFRSRDPLELKDIFIAVKTTRKYHRSRLELLIQTWVSQAKEQVRRARGIYCCGRSLNLTVLSVGLDS